jgi:transcriptional regulator with XRE-family HTH domain
VENELGLELQKFGAKIREIRKSKNITQQQLAALCDVDIRTIQRIEKGGFNPSLKILRQLALAFDLSLSSLFSIID